MLPKFTNCLFTPSANRMWAAEQFFTFPAYYVGLQKPHAFSFNFERYESNRNHAFTVYDCIWHGSPKLQQVARSSDTPESDMRRVRQF